MILCCGEALIDMLPVDTPQGTAFVPHAGGAVFNTAIALGRLGAPAGFFSGLSADFFGDKLRASLVESKVDTTHCVIADRPCTLAFVRLVDGQATYAFYDENTAGRLLALSDLPDTNAEALFFGGISLVAEPCATTYEALMMRERGQRVIMMDPNIRPSFITDEAAYRARMTRMIAASVIVKMSTDDLDWLAKGDAEGMTQQILAAGTSILFLTDGSVGAHAVTKRGTIFEPARKVTVVDTVGAGDTFNAGVLASLHQSGALTCDGIREADDETIVAALQMGVASAAVTVSRAGANPPWVSELA